MYVYAGGSRWCGARASPELKAPGRPGAGRQADPQMAGKAAGAGETREGEGDERPRLCPPLAEHVTADKARERDVYRWNGGTY